MNDAYRTLIGTGEVSNTSVSVQSRVDHLANRMERVLSGHL